MLRNTWPVEELTLKKVECDTFVYFIKILKAYKCQKEKIETRYNPEKDKALEEYLWKHKGIDMQISILSLTGK